MRHLQLLESISDAIDGHPEVVGPFLQGGIGMMGDMLPQGSAIKLPSPGAMRPGGQVGATAPIMDAPTTHAKPPSCLRLPASFLDKLNHTFSQVDAVGHSGKQYT